MSKDQLPAYTDAEIKQALLDAGASGTIYSLVMPESEAVLAEVIDGGSAGRDAGLLDLYREAWTQKQDAMHERYFDRWIDWSAPIVKFDASQFRHRYPTAGASEGISPSIHIFEGEYEGFPAYASSLGIPLTRHPRSEWREAVDRIEPNAQFWISQPSAIDGIVWPHFEAFARALADAKPQAELVPDITYVENVAREFTIELGTPNISNFVFSHSKPFGGYYHRVGGVFAKEEQPSLFGNKWFKNLLSLAWGTAMMKHFDVFTLPRKYAQVRQEAAHRIGALLNIDQLKPCDVNLLATAVARKSDNGLLQAVHRGCEGERVIRLCLTPSISSIIDPALAPSTSPKLAAMWRNRGLI